MIEFLILFEMILCTDQRKRNFHFSDILESCTKEKIFKFSSDASSLTTNHENQAIACDFVSDLPKNTPKDFDKHESTVIDEVLLNTSLNLVMHDDTTKIVENEFDINTDNLLANNGVFDENFETNIFDEEILFGLCEEEIEENFLEPQTKKLLECTTESYKEELSSQINFKKNVCKLSDGNNSTNLVISSLTNNSTTTNGIENPTSVVNHENNTVDILDFDTMIIQIIKNPQTKCIDLRKDMGLLDDSEVCKFCMEYYHFKIQNTAVFNLNTFKNDIFYKNNNILYLNAIKRLEEGFLLKFKDIFNLYNKSAEKTECIIANLINDTFNFDLEFFIRPFSNYNINKSFYKLADPNFNEPFLLTQFNYFLKQYNEENGKIFVNSYILYTYIEYKSKKVNLRGFCLIVLLYFLLHKTNEVLLLLIPDMYFLINEIKNGYHGLNILSKIKMVISLIAYKFQFIKLKYKEEAKSNPDILRIETIHDLPFVSKFILESKMIITSFYLHNFKTRESPVKHVMFSAFLTFVKVYYKSFYESSRYQEFVFSYFLNFDIDFEKLELKKNRFYIKETKKQIHLVKVIDEDYFVKFSEENLTREINFTKSEEKNVDKINSDLYDMIKVFYNNHKETNDGYSKLEMEISKFILKKYVENLL